MPSEAVRSSQAAGVSQPSDACTNHTPPQEAANTAMSVALEVLGSRTVAPSVEVVNHVMAAGAEVVRPGRGSQCALHRWARNGLVNLVKALLQTQRIINFRVTDASGNTPFHSVLCGPTKSGELVRELIGAMVLRLESHLLDTGESADESALTLWEVKNADGLDFLQLAFATGHFSVVYPLIKGRPFYSQRTEPLKFSTNNEVWRQQTPHIWLRTMENMGFTGVPSQSQEPTCLEQKRINFYLKTCLWAAGDLGILFVAPQLFVVNAGVRLGSSAVQRYWRNHEEWV